MKTRFSFKKIRPSSIILIVLLVTSTIGFAKPRTVVFYNTENLFDYFDDTTKNDNEFLPESDKHWTKNKYYDKLTNTYQAIAACGAWESPAIIGLCEVENRYCLDGLVLHTPFSAIGYDIVHYESEDQRGIDVALLYNPKLFTVLQSKPIRPTFKNTNIKTRDILYVSGILDRDTIHFFVNHWPSRRGGEASSEWKRIQVAKLLRQHIDSILAINPHSKILAMGDFNDEKVNKSIGQLERNTPSMRTLTLAEGSSEGSLKYKNNWQTFDLFIASSALRQAIEHEQMNILKIDFLLTEDKQYLGKKPFRTYAGPRYLGGYSDHLPIFIQINTHF